MRHQGIVSATANRIAKGLDVHSRNIQRRIAREQRLRFDEPIVVDGGARHVGVATPATLRESELSPVATSNLASQRTNEWSDDSLTEAGDDCRVLRVQCRRLKYSDRGEFVGVGIR